MVREFPSFYNFRTKVPENYLTNWLRTEIFGLFWLNGKHPECIKRMLEKLFWMLRVGNNLNKIGNLMQTVCNALLWCLCFREVVWSHSGELYFLVVSFSLRIQPPLICSRYYVLNAHFLSTDREGAEMGSRSWKTTRVVKINYGILGESEWEEEIWKAAMRQYFGEIEPFLRNLRSFNCGLLSK